ncbi:MAG TPA: hypothetical protein PK725_02490 [Rhodocyclaceae bacterium]|nr:hypothetical protein [Rhodocyclaceae bacterium]
MSAPGNVDLDKLPALGELFAMLNAGKHLNRMADHRLWAELEREQTQYETLFAALGYTLRIDGRGFAWFHFDEASSTVSKTTRQLALLFMLIFEFKADAGLHLGRFIEWPIDDELLTGLIEKNRMLLESENLAEREQLAQLMKAASTYGFAKVDGAGWRLLPSVFRYLDRFEELAHRESTQTTVDSEDVEEDAE